jgi:hypothetical protein
MLEELEQPDPQDEEQEAGAEGPQEAGEGPAEELEQLPGVNGEELRASSDSARFSAMLDLFRDKLRGELTGGARENAAVVMTGHMALESANFKSFPRNSNNLLGINARPGDPYVNAMDSDKTVHKFRLFGNVNDLVTYYIMLVKNYYPDAFEAAAIGDVTGYAAGLKNGKAGRQYYGAKLSDSTKGLAARVKLVKTYV